MSAGKGAGRTGHAAPSPDPSPPGGEGAREEGPAGTTCPAPPTPAGPPAALRIKPAGGTGAECREPCLHRAGGERPTPGAAAAGAAREPAAALSPAAPSAPAPGRWTKGEGARPGPVRSGSLRRTPETQAPFLPAFCRRRGLFQVGTRTALLTPGPRPGSGESRCLPGALVPLCSLAAHGDPAGVRGLPASPLAAPHGSAQAAGPGAELLPGTAEPVEPRSTRYAQPSRSPLPAAHWEGGRLVPKAPRSFLLIQADRLVPSSIRVPLPHKFIHMLLLEQVCALRLCSWATSPGGWRSSARNK